MQQDAKSAAVGDQVAKALESGAASAREAAGKAADGVSRSVGTAERYLFEYGPDVLTVLLILVAAWLLAGWARKTIRRGLDRAHFDVTLSRFFSNLVRWAILAVAVVMCLSRFGVETASFAALIAALGLAIGLALQGSLSHLAAGVMLLVFRPFKVGDGVLIGGHSGVVNELDLFTTTIDTADGRRIIVPNGQIFGNVIENQTHHPRRSTSVNVVLTGSADLDRAKRTLTAAAQATTGVLLSPPPGVALTGIDGGNLTLSVTAWAKTAELGAVREVLLRNIRDTLVREGMVGPRPVMDVTVKQVQ